MNRDARGGAGAGPLAGAPGMNHARGASGPPRWRAPPPARRDGARSAPSLNAEAAKAAWAPDAPVAGTDYKVVRLLGSGGMGTVYEVEHFVTRQRYAMKVLSSRVAERPDFAARLLLEAKTLAALPDQPHLVKVYESGTLPQGRPYYVMELLAGETLRAKLNRGRPPMPYACLLVVQLLAGLAAVHGAGIVHRDVKPDNLFIRADGVCKLLDFGVIKVLSESGLSPGNFVTVPGSIIGTRHYLAPEVIEARGPDKRADIFAAGVVLAECLTGSLPLADAPEDEYHRYVFEHGFPPLDGPNAAHVPAELRAIVARATRRDPAQRYASVEAFATELASAAARLGLGSLTARSIPPEAGSVRPPPLRAPPPPPVTVAATAVTSGNTDIDVPCTLTPDEHIPRYPSEGATLIREPAPDSLERSRPSGPHKTPEGDDIEFPPDTAPRGANPIAAPEPPPAPWGNLPGTPYNPALDAPGSFPSPSPSASPSLSSSPSTARPLIVTPLQARVGRGGRIAAIVALATAGLGAVVGVGVAVSRSRSPESVETLTASVLPSGAVGAPRASAHPLAWGDPNAPSAAPAPPPQDDAPPPPAAANDAIADAPAATNVAATAAPATPANEAAAPAATNEAAPTPAAPAGTAVPAANAANEAAPARTAAALAESPPARAAGAANEAAPARVAASPPPAAEADTSAETGAPAGSAKRPSNATQPHRLKRGFKSGLLHHERRSVLGSAVSSRRPLDRCVWPLTKRAITSSWLPLPLWVGRVANERG